MSTRRSVVHSEALSQLPESGLVIHQVLRADVTVLKLIWPFCGYRERRQVALRIQKKCNVPGVCPPSALRSVLAVFVFRAVSPLSPLCFWLLWEIPWHQKDEKTKRRILCYILPTLKFSEQPPTEKKNGREEILKKFGAQCNVTQNSSFRLFVFLTQSRGAKNSVRWHVCRLMEFVTT